MGKTSTGHIIKEACEQFKTSEATGEAMMLWTLSNIIRDIDPDTIIIVRIKTKKEGDK